MREHGGWPEDLRDSPVIVDTGIGGDPDNALAVVAAARCLPHHLALVITSDETSGEAGTGQRARFARQLLNALDRRGTPVVAGASLGGARSFCVADLQHDAVPPQPDDVVSAVRAVCTATPGPVRWVGMGPLSNLARVLTEAPEVGARLRVTQRVGGLADRTPAIRRDVPAARAVLDAVRSGLPATIDFVTSDVTDVPPLRITPDHAVYRMLAADDAPAWAQLLTANMDRWFRRFHNDTTQHAALTLSAALGLPYVESDRAAVTIDETGRMNRDDDGTPAWLSFTAAYAPFMAWLHQKLDPAVDVRGIARSPRAGR